MSRAVMQREREALVAYLADCDANSIQPDVGGAWHAAFVAGAALAQRGEPVATLHDDGYFTWKSNDLRLKYDRPHAGWRMDVYAAPQPAPVAQPLTDEQIEVIIGDSDGRWNDGEFRIDGAGLVELINAVERAHGIGSKE